MEPCATCEDAERVSRGIKFETPSCPLWEQCQGRARDSTGHIKKADVINKFLESDEDTWSVQYLCRRGSRKGLVYESFEATDGPIGKTNVSSDVRYDAELPARLLD